MTPDTSKIELELLTPMHRVLCAEPPPSSSALESDWVVTTNVSDGTPGSIHQIQVFKQNSGLEKL